MRIEAQGALRLHMLEFEVEIGLTFKGSPEARHRKERARTIQGESDTTPVGLLENFADEVAAMRRFGKAVNRCHAMGIPPFRLYCLSHYSYDGLCAMLYVERDDGGFRAAWCEREMENRLAPHPVLIQGGESNFDAFLRHSSVAAHGRN
jgi:hypothetical protein